MSIKETQTGNQIQRIDQHAQRSNVDEKIGVIEIASRRPGDILTGRKGIEQFLVDPSQNFNRTGSGNFVRHENTLPK